MYHPKKTSSQEKSSLHVRSLHRVPYDFEALCETLPDLSAFVYVNAYENKTIDFANPQAVKLLNSALLRHFYEVDSWDIPAGYLCPPIPGRADYLHYLADLLASCNGGVIPHGNNVHVLDIGTGANMIYPIIGIKVYGWNFTGTDTDASALKNADLLRDKNIFLKQSVELRLQKNPQCIFQGIITGEEHFDVTMCNPPFHASAEEAASGSLRKVRNMGKKNTRNPVLNFGGQHGELWCPGGETSFIKQMVEESTKWNKNIFWFSTLVAKSMHLKEIYRQLEIVKAFDVRTLEMRQGQKISRVVAWTFFDKVDQQDWFKRRW